MAITLIGYRGTGKTTVGAELARRLGWDFVDVDEQIVQQTGKTIAAIFSEEGEPRFRELEADVLAEQLSREKVVVSAGGGAVLRDVNRQAMREAGPVIWLEASVKTISQRLQMDPATADQRPSLTLTDPLTEIAAVLASRQQYYEEAATITIHTDDRTPASIVDEILTRLPEERQ